jgi:hypothetical protein
MGHYLALPPPPMAHWTDNRLPAFVDCDALDPNGLLRLRPVSLKSIHLRCVGSRQLIERALRRNLPGFLLGIEELRAGERLHCLQV